MNKPMLIIFWYEGSEYHELGPFFSAATDGLDITGYKWRCYQVVDQRGEFRRITVPWNHTLQAILYT